MEQSNLAKNDQKSLKNEGFSFVGAMKSLLESYPKRSQEIVAERYGLKGEEEKTLEEIGDQFNVTRERVRQIIREVVRKIKEKGKSPLLDEARRKIAFTIQEKSGIMKEADLVVALSAGDKKEMGAIRFFVDLSAEVVAEKIAGELAPSLTLRNFKLDEWREIKDSAKEILTKEGALLADQQLAGKISGSHAVNAKKLFDYLAVSEEVKKNQFGNWGLSASEEVTPKGTREKAYLVLKESKKPLHFREISALIDKWKLNKRQTNPQTVHNELIKDERFVLVGRGIYALREWGYQSGTVKDLLENILKESTAPMGKEDILERLLKMRQVKKSTIVINLNNFFDRVGKDSYTIRK
jgi:DNA-directed RNA polymerase delta subunit